MPTMGEKNNILALMRETFDRRRSHYEYREQTTCSLIEEFPHFLSFGGEVVSTTQLGDFSLLVLNLS